jgi:serine/threonine protein kinase/WD40 repeat protein
MTQRPPTGYDQLTPALAQRIDEICDRLEAAWRAGQRPVLEEYLAEVPEPAASVLLRELILVDILYRQRAGDAVEEAEYQARFPDLGATWLQAALLPATVVPSGGWRVAGEEGTSFPAAATQPPFSVPGFDILEELGRGGMGVVYKARDNQLGRLVALKVPRPDILADPATQARFQNEARAAAKLDHPNIVPVYEAGEAGGACYIASAYCQGVSLAAWLKRRSDPVPAREAAALVATLADAAHHAHQRGIVHRDLKPANILLVSGEAVSGEWSPDTAYHSPVTTHHPRITDFGLAKHLLGAAGGEAGATRTGEILGTPSYMAPEQAGGKRDIGPAADVYALGAILYELLTGRPPFEGESTLEVLEQVRSIEPMPPSRLRLRVPRDLDTIALKCLEKEPRGRYSSALALAEDLRRFLEGKAIQARPLGPLRRLGRWCRRKPVVASLTAAVALLLTVVLVGAPLVALVLRRERDAALDKLRESYLARAGMARLSGQAGQQFASLELLASAAHIRPGDDVRDEAIACLALADLKVARDWEGYPRLDTALAFDAGLERYARGDDAGQISVRRVAEDDSQLVSLRALGPETDSTWAAFSPDGRLLAALYERPDQPFQAVVWDLASRELVFKVPAPEPKGWPLLFSPDGRRLATRSADGAVVFYEVPSGKEVKRWRGTGKLGPAAFHPRGTQLALASPEEEVIEVRDVETGAVAARRHHPRGVHAVAWQNDGSLLATGGDDHEIHIWETASYQPLASCAGHNGPTIFLAFSRTGDWLVSASTDGTTRLWETTTGRSLVTATGTAVRLSGDDRLLAFRDATRLGLWEVADGHACRLLQPLPQPGNGLRENHGVDISARERLLAVAGADGVRLWDLADGRLAADLRVGPGPVARFHPSGDSLVTSSRSGLRRWPIRPRQGQGGGTLQVGPPQTVAGYARATDYPPAVCWGPAGDCLAIKDPVTPDRAVVLNLEQPAERAVFRSHSVIFSLALSPDGRWLAAGSWQGDGVTVWDRATGEIATELPGSRPGANSTTVAFSPDGRWLVVGGQGEYRFWATGSWQAGLVLARDHLEPTPGPLAFSRDGRVLAIAPSARRLRLVAADTGKTLATLTPPRSRMIRELSFSADGALLAVAGDGPVQLWDLRHIGEALASREFDWGLPAFRPSEGAAARPVEVLQEERPRPGR